MTIEIEIEVMCEECKEVLAARYDFITQRIFVKKCKCKYK